jgi:hypothetical protein
MLNYLKNYELDWGIIAVYTCEKECDVNGKYVKEFCYKQDVQKSDDDEDVLAGLSGGKFEKLEIDEEEGSPMTLSKEQVVNIKVAGKLDVTEQGTKRKKVDPVVMKRETTKKIEKAFEECENWD